MTAEGAVRQAGAEGLTLLRSDNGTGYKGVNFHKRVYSKPYQAKVQRGGKRVRTSAASPRPRRRRLAMQGLRRQRHRR